MQAVRDFLSPDAASVAQRVVDRQLSLDNADDEDETEPPSVSPVAHIDGEAGQSPSVATHDAARRSYAFGMSVSHAKPQSDPHDTRGLVAVSDGPVSPDETTVTDDSSDSEEDDHIEGGILNPLVALLSPTAPVPVPGLATAPAPERGSFYKGPDFATHLLGCEPGSPASSELVARRHYFHIQSPFITYYLYAETVEDMQGWLAAFAIEPAVEGAVAADNEGGGRSGGGG
jgi:hypothetical protein